ncbi:MAG: CinA family protein, partial [Isosphaeraceae bacterium]
ERFADLITGTGDEDVEHALFKALLARKATVATAESCTGGQVARKITSLAGSSEVYPGGVVSYANSAKISMLEVPEHLLKNHGAVSAEVAAAMAEGARLKFGATYGIATTGIAGPGGGSAEKPVGLVWLGLATPEGVFTKRLQLGEEQPRAVIQERATKHALNFLRVYLRDLKA